MQTFMQYKTAQLGHPKQLKTRRKSSIEAPQRESQAQRSLPSTQIGFDRTLIVNFPFREASLRFPNVSDFDLPPRRLQFFQHFGLCFANSRATAQVCTNPIE
jgi:hypothetical protein